MSATPGPSIITNGLVFEIDPANTAKLALGSNSTNFIQNGYFANGADSPQNIPGTNNPTNTFVILPNPGESDYVLRQNGFFTEYELQLTTQMLPSTTYVMSGWYAKSTDYNDIDTMFHSRAMSASGNNITTGYDIGTVIATKVIGGLIWSYCYQTITTPSDYSNAFYWYVGYGANNTTGFRYYTNLKVERGTFPTLPDLSGNNNNARPENGVTYSSSNQGVLVFDATNDNLQLGNASQYIGASQSQITINAWVKTNQTNVYRKILVTNTPGTQVIRGLYFSIGPDVGFRTYFGVQSGVTTADAATNTIISTTQYTNLCGTYDGSNIRLYINGVLEGTGSLSGNINNGGIMRISGYDNNLETWNGTMGQISIYNRALTNQEVVQNFNALRSRYGI